MGVKFLIMVQKEEIIIIISTASYNNHTNIRIPPEETKKKWEQVQVRSWKEKQEGEEKYCSEYKQRSKTSRRTVCERTQETEGRSN